MVVLIIGLYFAVSSLSVYIRRWLDIKQSAHSNNCQLRYEHGMDIAAGSACVI